MGWIAQCRAWLQNRSAPPLLQPWRTLRKLFWKDAAARRACLAALPATPYVLFGTMVLAAAIIPSVATDLPFVWVADAIALVGVFRHRAGLHLARGDGHRHRLRHARGAAGDDDRLPGRAGAADGVLQRLPHLREHRPAQLVERLAAPPFVIYPSLAFAGVAFVMVLLAENARHADRQSGDASGADDDPRGDGAGVLGAPPGPGRVGLGPQALQLRLHRFRPLRPLGYRAAQEPARGAGGAGPWRSCAQAGVRAGAVLALVETVSAKLRIFRAPEFLAMAFLLAVLGLLVHLLLGA